jgi:hypothetical protein
VGLAKIFATAGIDLERSLDSLAEAIEMNKQRASV